ncbi:MAG: aspartyl protease family protein [Deltaproteobacteria bacterium]|nr:aspartyl protease family protein [Deltaproteobacteria bacterium]
MKLTLIGGLPFIAASITYRGQSITLDHILVDTGSAGTVFAADHLVDVDVLPEPNDPLRRIAGVGGAEYVFEKTVDELDVGELSVRDFRIEVGALDYGFDINGIIGIDFLMASEAVLDLKSMTLFPA